jgi:Zn-dependent peptidase ImmA (M78 family)/transcriptional regulator with XRE-family HTH domain
MTRGKPVPITPSVLEWALSESGYSLEALAKAIDVESATIRAWLKGEQQPSITDLRTLASALKRPVAAFLLPRPPQLPKPAIEFRAPRGSGRAHLNFTERTRIREAVRLQRMLAWLMHELGEAPASVPQGTIKGSPETQARETRDRLGITIEQQQQWRSASAALQGWRRALERTGVFVFTVPMGEDSARGFSLWDEQAPLIALNTSWNAEARIFTLFHEYAHLLTQTSSACLEVFNRLPTSKSDPTERWCEQFAADVVIPRQALEEFLVAEGLRRPVTDLKAVGRIARHFRASLRAATLRLISVKAATWPLYRSLPAQAERKPPGGGGPGRTRAQIRVDQYGLGTTDAFETALKKDLVTRADVLDYLDMPPHALGRTAVIDEHALERD